MSKIAVIGPEMLFGGFAALGVVVMHADTSDEAKVLLSKIVKEKEYSIIYILEKFAIDVQDLIEEISKQSSPTLVVLPGVGEEIGFGVNRIRDLVQKASGQNII